MRLALLLVAVSYAFSANSSEPGEVFQKAVAAQERRDYETAERLYRELLRGHPDAPPVRVNLASVLLAERHYPNAVTILMPAESANQGDLVIAWLLGNALIYSGRPLEGVIRIEKVSASGKADAALLAAETRLKLDQYDKALQQIEAALRIDPYLAGAHTLRGMIFEHSGNYPGAISDLEIALKADPQDFNAHLYLGAILLYHRELEPALAHLQKAVELDPGSPLALYELAMVKRAQGETESAAQDLEKAELASPKWIEPHVELAALYYRLNRRQDGLRERKIVDQLSAMPKSSIRPLASAAP